MLPKYYDVVVSGISGKFPECDSIEELESKLLNMENMVTTDDRKWKPGELNVPSATGKFKTNITLDNNFFAVNNRLFRIMDPSAAQYLKNSFEAICDAGVNPSDLSGTNTAVIMSSFINEKENLTGQYEKHQLLLGRCRNMQSNRVSFTLNLQGPSYTIDASWNGGIQSLQIAYELISTGLCTAALVGSCNTIFGPELSFHYQAMGKLNNDGKTKCFSADADGYSRSEACSVFFLQRPEDAKRSYGTILSVVSTDCGIRTSAFTEFCPDQYTKILRQTFQNAKIDPSEVSYVEADGSASKEMDAMELNSIAKVMCANRKTPLHVGSIKSNIGHTEAASSMMSITKALIALKTGIIPPNLHYSSPNPDVPSLVSGQLKVVTEPTPLNGDIVAVSSVSLAGTYGHVIIKGSPKIKRQLSGNNLPWLFLISGRTEDALKNVLEKVVAKPFNEEFIRISHKVFMAPIKGYTFKGYTMLNTEDQQEYEVKQKEGEKRPVWFLFSGMGSQWVGMGASLMRLPTFAKAIHFCHKLLLQKGINLLNLIHTTDPNIFDDCIMNSFVGIAAVQIGLVDLLKELGIEPDGIIGHSVGELGCAYADGCYTAEQAILSAYARGKASIEGNLIDGLMAAVGKGYNEIKDILPPSIEVACHNSKKSCTISGPAEDMRNYVADLKKNGIFAKLINATKIAYHSRYIKPAAPIFLENLKQVIPEPKIRSKRWISSSVPESSWDSDLAKYSSAEYHTNNLLSPVLFEEASAHIPQGAIVIEIAPHGLLQSIVKQSLNTCINIPLTNRFAKDGLVHLFKAFGKLYLEGLTMNIDKLYPKFEYPISVDTPSPSELLTWDDREGLGHLKFKQVEATSNFIKLVEEEVLQKYFGHKLNGKEVIIFPALIWNVVKLFQQSDKDATVQRPVMLENIQYKEQIEMSNNYNKEIYTQIQKGSGSFEVILNSHIILTGRINTLDYGIISKLKFQENFITHPQVEMNHEEIYKYFEEFSIEFKDSFKLIQKVSLSQNDLKAVVLWKGEWIEFLDALLMVVTLHDTLQSNQLKIVGSIRQISIDFTSFQFFKAKEITVSYNKHTHLLCCEGLQIHMALTRPSNVVTTVLDLAIKSCQFLAYCNQSNEDKYETLNEGLNAVLQNSLPYQSDCVHKLKVIFEDNIILETFRTMLSRCNNNQEIDVITGPTEEALNDLYLNLDKRDNLLIIGELAAYKRTVKCLKKVNAGFLLLKSETNIGKWNLVYPIMKFQIKDEFYTLYKTCYKDNAHRNSINVKINNNNWKSDLKTLIKKEMIKTNSSEIIYLIGRFKSLSTVYKIFRSFQNFENSHMIRFLFMDEDAPPFYPELQFYKEQMMKDLVMNICVNNTWGCLELLTPHNETAKAAIKEDQQDIYPLSSIKCKNVKLTTLGLNLSNTDEVTQKEKLGVFEYCGIDKSGNTLYGIGTLSERDQLVEDKILSWQKPPNWTNEEAVSIPLCYTIAYYIFRVNPMEKEGNWIAVLVHNGTMPVSQAIINVALSFGHTIFTTYKTIKEKKQILQLFPQIPKDNIFLCESKSFEVPIMMKTKKKGVDFIVNTSPDYSIIKTSFKCTAKYGYFFQLNTQVLNKECFLGMQIFDKCVQFFSLPAELLLELSAAEKETLQKKIVNGIVNNHVKPLKTASIPATTLNLDAIEMLKNVKDAGDKRIVASYVNNEEENKDSSVFICSAQRSYLIISHGNIFINLMHWLISRGAKTIHVLTKQNLAHSTIQRLKSTANNHPSVNIILHSSEMIHDRDAIKTIFTDINGVKEISETFIVGEEMEKEITIIDSVLRDIKSACRLVCVGNGGEAVYESRREDGLPALVISCQIDHLMAPVILTELDRLLHNVNANAIIFLENEKDTSRTNEIVASNDRIPENTTELLMLNQKSMPRACFVEVMASCAQYKYNKGISPIFVIPGLKPNELDKLTCRLFHPTFEARLPQDIECIDTVAKHLYQDLKRFKLNVFTLITNDWGGVLGLHLAKYLENDGKVVMLIMLDTPPCSEQSWVSAVLQMGDINLINHYVNMPYKIKKKLHLVSGWQEKVELALENCVSDETEREGIRNGLNMVRNCLMSVMKYRATDQKFQGKYFMYYPSSSRQNDHSNITQFCERRPVTDVISANSHQDMLDNPEMAKIINSLIPYEYKSTAHPINCERFGEFIAHEFINDRRL